MFRSPYPLYRHKPRLLKIRLSGVTVLDVIRVVPNQLLEPLALERMRVANVDVLDFAVAEKFVDLFESLEKY